MPSTRSPPLKMMLPSTRVVAPIRLSMRFCGLVGLLNIFFSPSKRRGVRRTRLARAPLVHAHLHVLDLRLGIDAKNAVHAAEVLERQPEGGCACIGGFREAHHSTLPPFGQSHHELQASPEFAFAQGARRDEEQV